MLILSTVIFEKKYCGHIKVVLDSQRFHKKAWVQIRKLI